MGKLLLHLAYSNPTSDLMVTSNLKTFSSQTQRIIFKSDISQKVFNWNFNLLSLSKSCGNMRYFNEQLKNLLTFDDHRESVLLHGEAIDTLAFAIISFNSPLIYHSCG